MYESAIYSITSDFLNDYPQSKYPEIMLKKARPLECLLIDVRPDYFICIPFRSNITHKNAFMFKNSARSKRTKSGLDYSKIILIKDSKYLDTNVVVDSDEYNEVQMNIDKIISDALDYIDTYVEHINGSSVLSAQKFKAKYGYTTLQYFHDILL